MTTPKLEIIVGTYEAFLLGYKLETKNEKEVLTQSFADKSHSGSLRCVAVKGKWIATGSTDDRIFLYDMKSRKQSQIILTHEGSINSVAFTPDETHLLSAGDDGRMIATRLNTWFTEANWKKAHSGSAVTHVSCHPSGKLALSLGSDRVLRTWNLVKGRVAYKTNLKSRTGLGPMPECMTWSPSGDYFTLSGPRVVEFWSIKSADVLRSQKTNSKPICLCWIAEEQCLVGLEDGKILWLSVQGEEEKEIIIEAHNSRVKAMSFLKGNLVTAASSGEIKLWTVLESKHKLKEIAVNNIGCRPTCIDILDLEQFGADYILHKSVTEKPLEKTAIKPKMKPQQRGVVTIEYEDNDAKNESSNNDEEENSNDDDDESAEESNNEEASEGEENQQNDDEEDAEEEEEEEQQSDSDSDSNGNDDIQDHEPQLRLPKSRKRKMQLLKSQAAMESKQQKLNEQAATNSKKSNKKPQQQNKSPQQSGGKCKQKHNKNK